MIFPSTLLVGSDSSQMIDHLLADLGHLSLTNNPDVLIQNEYSINGIRQLQLFLSQKPYSHSSKLIIIYQAEQLHLEAQNALLKTLEEPGENNYLILTTSKPQKLLPTIISRCHLIKSRPANKKVNPTPFTLSSVLPSDKKETLALLEDQLTALHQQLKVDPSPKTSRQISKLIRAIQMIESNVDPRAAVDYYLLS